MNRQTNTAIGVIDSGSGGLSVWNEIALQLPHESLIYVGDHRYLPYSTKSRTFIRRRVVAVIRFLLSKHVKMVVVACNTATVAGIAHYRKVFPDLPIIGVVPVVKKAVERTLTGHIAVFSTSYTANSPYQKWLIRKFAAHVRVENIGSPDLVTRIEAGERSSDEVRHALETLLSPITETAVDVLALGCTHYPFLRDEIRAIVGERVMLLDSGGAVARHVRRVLQQNGVLRTSGNGRYAFHTTGNAAQVTDVAQTLLGKPVRFRHTSIAL